MTPSRHPELLALLDKPETVEIGARAIENAQRTQHEAYPVSDREWNDMKTRQQCTGNSTYLTRVAQMKAALSALKLMVEGE